MQTSHFKFWLRSSTLTLAAAATLFATGCGERVYVAGPPPPGPPPIVQEAEQNGFRIGLDDGARDAETGFGYHPRAGRAFQETPGYNPRLGPFGAYRADFRTAYLRGYNNAFRRR